MNQQIIFLFLLLASCCGFTFIDTQNLPIGRVIFFAKNGYNNTVGNAFVDQIESIVKFTATPAATTKETVIFAKEVSTAGFSISDTLGSAYGTTAKIDGSGNFALAADEIGFYTYGEKAVDENPANGNISSAFLLLQVNYQYKM
ncbi:MAG: hypothetical protein ACKVOM_02065 [Ferruginibacter sp.]